MNRRTRTNWLINIYIWTSMKRLCFVFVDISYFIMNQVTFWKSEIISLLIYKYFLFDWTMTPWLTQDKRVCCLLEFGSFQFKIFCQAKNLNKKLFLHNLCKCTTIMYCLANMWTFSLEWGGGGVTAAPKAPPLYKGLAALLLFIKESPLIFLFIRTKINKFEIMSASIIFSFLIMMI